MLYRFWMREAGEFLFQKLLRKEIPAMVESTVIEFVVAIADFNKLYRLVNVEIWLPIDVTGTYTSKISKYNLSLSSMSEFLPQADANVTIDEANKLCSAVIVLRSDERKEWSSVQAKADFLQKSCLYFLCTIFCHRLLHVPNQWVSSWRFSSIHSSCHNKVSQLKLFWTNYHCWRNHGFSQPDDLLICLDPLFNLFILTLNFFN